MKTLVRCLTVSLLALLLVGCSSSAPAPASKATAAGTPAAPAGAKRIIFVTNGDDPFWDACLSGLNEGAKQHKLAEAGLSVQRDVNNGTAEGQIEKLRQYATQDDIAGVAISVIQADNQAIIEEMKNLQTKGVKIITVDGDVNRDALSRRPHLLHRHRQHRRRPHAGHGDQGAAGSQGGRRAAATCSSPASPTTTTPAAA